MRTLALAAVAALTFSNAAAQVTDLAPPPGPVANSGPTVVNNLPGTPFTGGGGVHEIAQPGSYVLNRDVSAFVADPMTMNARAIDITADDVTVDLGGFSIVNNNASQFDFGIDMIGDNVTIRNGTIKGFSCAIGNSPRTFTPGTSITIENVTICDGKLDVSRFANATICNVTIKNPPAGAQALITGNNATIKNVKIEGAESGIKTGLQSVVTQGVVNGTGTGPTTSHGIETGNRSIVTECVVDNVAGNGIVTGSSCSVSRTRVNRCANGYSSLSQNTYTDCEATNCSIGAYAQSFNSSYTRCGANNNNSVGTSGGGCTWTGCIFTTNQGPLTLSGPTALIGCSFPGTFGTGISIQNAGSNSRIEGCDFEDPFGAFTAVECDAAGVQIKNNFFVNFGMGVNFTPGSSNCWLTGNTFNNTPMPAAGNTAGNKVAPVISDPATATSGLENLSCP